MAKTKTTTMATNDDVEIFLGGKPFPDPNNLFRWFIEREELDSQTAKPTGETVTSYFRYEEDFERGLDRYVSGMRAYGIYER